MPIIALLEFLEESVYKHFRCIGLIDPAGPAATGQPGQRPATA
jgi:hypothetical protein